MASRTAAWGVVAPGAILCGIAAVGLAPGLGAQKPPKRVKFVVSSTTIGVARNLKSDRRLPVVFAPRADGSGCLGYTDTKGNLRVFSVNRDFKKSSAELAVRGLRLVGLQPHTEGSYVVLASSSEGTREQAPVWAFGDNTLWALKIAGDGKVVFKTRLVGGRGYGPQAIWFESGSAANLCFDGTTFGAFYSVGKNWARSGAAPNQHEGDEFKAFDASGKVDTAMSCTWNCSHSWDQRMIVARGEFATLTMGDMYPVGLFFKSHASRAHSAVWPPRPFVDEMRTADRKSFSPGGCGGIAVCGDGYAGIATTWVRETVAESRNEDVRFVLFVQFDRTGKTGAVRHLTTGPAPRSLRACIASFGPHSLVGWGVPGTKDSTLAVVRADGSYHFEPRKTKVPLPHRAAFTSMPDGDVVWAYARGGSRKIMLIRAELPPSLDSPAPPRPAPVTAANPPEDPPRVAPRPKGKITEIVTYFTDGSVKTRYSIDGEQKRTGWLVRYFRSGRVRVRTKYAGGVKWGEHEEFRADGSRRVSTSFVDGLEHGVRIEYDAHGKETGRQRYVDGEPAGG